MFVSEITAKYVRMKNAQVTLEKFTDGTLALVASDVDEDGFPNEETLSINLTAYGMYPPEGHVYVKDYSEHEGLAEALVKAGLVEIVEPVTFGPYGTGQLVRITDATLRFALEHDLDASKSAAEEAQAEADRLKENEA